MLIGTWQLTKSSEAQAITVLRCVFPLWQQYGTASLKRRTFRSVNLWHNRDIITWLNLQFSASFFSPQRQPFGLMMHRHRVVWPLQSVNTIHHANIDANRWIGWAISTNRVASSHWRIFDASLEPYIAQFWTSRSSDCFVALNVFPTCPLCKMRLMHRAIQCNSMQFATHLCPCRWMRHSVRSLLRPPSGMYQICNVKIIASDPSSCTYKK